MIVACITKAYLECNVQDRIGGTSKERFTLFNTYFIQIGREAVIRIFFKECTEVTFINIQIVCKLTKSDGLMGMGINVG